MSRSGERRVYVHTFQVDVVVVEDRLIPKRRPNLLLMGILLITECMY